MNKNVNGVEISYEICGDGPARILLLHGWGCDISLMKPLAQKIDDGFQVLIPEFPGHGKSGKPPEPWGVKEYAECLKEFLKIMDYTPCHVIAHSFGCRVAAWLAAEDPAIFNKMIFTGAAGIRPVLSDEAKKKSEKYKRLKSYGEEMKRIPFLRGAAEKYENYLREKYGSRDYKALDPEMRKTFVKVVNEDLSDLYSKIKNSTLLIWGDKDTETPLWMAEEMKRKIPDAGLVPLPGGSHFAYLEQLNYFVVITKQFLKEEEQNALHNPS